MHLLKKHPQLTIRQVAEMYGVTREELRNSQLQMLKKIIRRDSPAWDRLGLGIY